MGADDRIPVHRAAELFRSAVGAALLTGVDTAVVFHDLSRLRQRIEDLRSVFPERTLHAVAIKANPLVGVLRCVVEAGAGLEAASVEEVHLALAAGCAPSQIVFDSPAKTEAELDFALERGVYINADNLDELGRIDSLRARRSTTSGIGLRVNPQVGGGTIPVTSVGTRSSRFGVPLDVLGESEVVAAFARYPWLEGLHVHVGSQGCELSLLVAAVQRVWDLRATIHVALGRHVVTALDIGGGVPATYDEMEPKYSILEYASALRRGIPALFASDVRLVTELGRSLQAGCGFAVTRVEHVKRVGDECIAVVHLGADFLLRPVYQPQHWHHDIWVLDAAGVPKQGPSSPWTVAGPLCFAGDILERGCSLPVVEVGDYVLIRDVGAYTLSLWSRHCNRSRPLVLGVAGRERGAAAEFVVLLRRETAGDIVRQWSP